MHLNGAIVADVAYDACTVLPGTHAAARLYPVFTTIQPVCETVSKHSTCSKYSALPGHRTARTTFCNLIDCIFKSWNDSCRGRWETAPSDGGPAPFKFTVHRGSLLQDGWLALRNAGGVKGWSMHALVSFGSVTHARVCFALPCDVMMTESLSLVKNSASS